MFNKLTLRDWLIVGVIFFSLLSLLACRHLPIIGEEQNSLEEVETTEEVATAPTNTLEAVLQRGALKCGVNENLKGFGIKLSTGNYEGFDIDFCKAVATAILGKPTVEYIPLNAAERFTALSDGTIDVLIRNTTWTATRDMKLGNSFVATTFYDGQGILVYSDTMYTGLDLLVMQTLTQGTDTLMELSGSTICVVAGTTTERNIVETFNNAGVPFKILPFETNMPLRAAFGRGICNAISMDKSALLSFQATLDNPDELTLAGATLSKEPLGPVTRDNDSEFYDVVQWTVFGMIQAEELGVTSENVDRYVQQPFDPRIAKLLGVSYNGGEVLDVGLAIRPQFMQDVIKQVGNYGEVYDRHLTPLGLTRENSLNALWQNGGLIYSPPFK